MRCLIFTLGLLSIHLLSAAGAARGDENVPGFLMGRTAEASAESRLPQRWSSTENVRWKADLPGLAWSSPIVWGDRIFVTTCVSEGADHEPRKGLYLEDLDANKYAGEPTPHQWRVMCLDLNSGKVIWDQLAHRGVPAKPHHIKNTLASETPVTDGEHVYALFGNQGLYCYDLDGNLKWKQEIAPRETHYGWGTSMSPVLHGDRLYYVNDNQEESKLLALDKRTGEVLWEVARDEKTNYSTPFIWENPLRTEIVVSGINWATSYDLSGKELWKIKGKSILAIPTPFEQFGLLYITSGHVAWGENWIFAVRPGGSGDLSQPEGTTEGSTDYLAWYRKLGPYHPTPLIVDETLYMLFDYGFMAALNAKTGEVVYSKKRIPLGRAFTSSPWTYAGKIFCVNEDGVTFAIKPGPDFEILYTNELAEDDMCMATPVIVGDRLLIRSSARIYCLQEGARLASSGE